MDELPVTLDETYENALKGIDKEKRGYANRLFHCLVVSIRPLRVKELAELFAILPQADSTPEFNIGWRPEDPEEFILSTCKTLVSIVNIDGERVIQFSHFSVREYLTSIRLAYAAPVSHFHILPKLAHTLLARACLSVLFQLDCSIDKTKIQSFPLALYAAEHWVDHARCEDVASDIQDEVDCLFDRNKPYFSVWIWLHDVDDSWIPYGRPPHPTQPVQAPLYYAALCGFHDLSERLLDAYPGDINARGGYYETPLQGALYKGFLGIVLLLLERGADPGPRDHDGQTALYRASSRGYSEVVRSLIDRGADLNAECNDRDEYGKEVGRTPLHAATYNGHRDIALFLLEGGANAETRSRQDQTPLYMASSRGFAEVVRLLIDHGADVDAKCDDLDGSSHVRWTPLHVASCHGNLEVARVLFERGVDVHYQDNWGWSPLHYASRHPFNDVARLLLNHGVNPDAPNNEGDTALHIASLKGHNTVVKLLLEYGTYVDARSKSRATPLFLASEWGRLDVVKLLLVHGADVNAQQDAGWTALHRAVCIGHVQAVEVLLECGADPYVETRVGVTPIQMANASPWVSKEEDQKQIIRLLSEGTSERM